MLKARTLHLPLSLSRARVLSIASLITALTVSVSLKAAPVTFTIDPARSSITLSGVIVTMPILEQSPGGLTATFAGNLDVELSDDAIAFSDSSRLSAQNSGNWEPGLNGADGTAPAAYGLRISSFLAEAVAAARDLELTVRSKALPLVGGAFDSSEIAVEFTPEGTSSLDYSVVSPLLTEQDRLSLSGLTTNEVTSMATLTTDGGVETLTIPVEATYFFGLLADGDTRLSFAGQIVATRNVGGVRPTTYEEFIAAEFPGRTEPAVVGATADPDGDGLPNFVEFAFSLEPNTADGHFAPLTAQIDAESPEERILEFERPEGLTGISYQLETSTDLRTWSPVTATPEITSLGNGRERVVFRDTESSSPRLIRLTISIAE